MVAPIRQTTSWQDGYDAIIDVRTPSEFTDDHIPGAINLPVMNDDERAEIGTIYKQIGSFRARQLGAQYAARNIAAHLDRLMAHDASWRPLLYCWRGGQRSGSMARILAEIGWVTTTIEGGYKTYRKYVMNGLADIAPRFDLILLQGPTGSAKTHLINAAAQKGVQAIDLEGLAMHRGSLLGAEPGDEQPSQRMFESRLYDALSRLDMSRPVLVEAESSRIGCCNIPKDFWHNMHGAPQIYIDADLDSRVDFLIRDYPHLIRDPTQLDHFIDSMTLRHGHKVTAAWREMAAAADWPALVAGFITTHYDPAYQNSAERKASTTLATITPTRLDMDGIPDIAAEIATIMDGIQVK